MGMVPLIFTDMRSELRKEIYATDASETGAGICMSTGVTKHGLEQAMIERETGELLTADEAAASLVHGLRSEELIIVGLTSGWILACRSVRRHGRPPQLLRRSGVGRLFWVIHGLSEDGTSTSMSCKPYCPSVNGTLDQHGT